MGDLQPLGGAPGRPADHIMDIPLPWSKPPLSLNDGGATRQAMFSKAKRIQEVRATIVRLMDYHQVPKAAEYARVQLHYLPADNRRRDTDNCVATLKPICDAIAAGTEKSPGYGVVEDDTPVFMAKPEPIIYHRPPKTPPKLWLTLQIWNHPAPPTTGGASFIQGET